MNWKNLNSAAEQFCFPSPNKSDNYFSEFIQQSATELIDSIPALLSYPDDEGIALNEGRVGAALAGDNIRKFLYKMTWPLLKKPTVPILYDLGSLPIIGDLKERHENARAIVKDLLPKHTVFSLGGGHDYAFADGAAFIESFAGDNSSAPCRPLIVNLDAHLDVRPTTWGLNSGTPFFRLLTEFNKKFQFLELGLQKQCNSVDHWQWAIERGAELSSLDEIRQIGTLPLLKSILQGSSKKQKCFISLDIDVFAQFLTNGCSQSWGAGLTYQEGFEIINWLLENKDVRLFSIYEVSPPLDFNHSTSKLAANLLHYVISKKYNTKV
jgi:formiminoglutamase